MKRWISGFTALSGFVALLFAGQSALAADRQSHIYFDNKSDAFVWVTAYATPAGCHSYVTRCQVGEAYGAWCVAPNTFDKHGLREAVYEVRAEVSEGGCQRNPVLLNQLRGFPYSEADTQSGYSNKTMTYYITGSHGKYVYGNH